MDGRVHGECRVSSAYSTRANGWGCLVRWPMAGGVDVVNKVVTVGVRM